MKKRFLSSLLTLVMALSLLPVSAFAANHDTVTEPVPGQVTAHKELVSQTPDEDGNYTVKLTVQGNPVNVTEASNADVVLVVDNSASMAANTVIRGLQKNRIGVAREVSEYFAEKILTDNTENRLAVIGFSGVALLGGADDTEAIRISTGLTDNQAVITHAIHQMTAYGTTNYTAALAKAQEILDTRTDDEKAARPAHVVFISDGAPGGLAPVQLTNPAFNGQVQAMELKDAGVTMYAIGIELSVPAFTYLTGLASAPICEHARNVFGECYDLQLHDILDNWATEITNTSAGKCAVLTDVVDTDKFTVVEDSLEVNGEDASFDEANENLTWNIGTIPSSTKTITFKIHANEGVCGMQIPTNRDVYLDYLDPAGDHVHLDKYVIGDPKVDIPCGPDPIEKDVYTIEYYYEDVVGHYPDTCETSETIAAEIGTVVETVDTAAHLKDGYVWDATEGLPLTVVEDTTKNLVKVYYALDKNDDDIADKYQIFVYYKATVGGTVTVPAEVITLRDAEGNFVREAESIELTGSEAVADEKYVFANWAGEGLPAEAADKANLAGTVLTDVKGGTEYVFTANFKNTDDGKIYSDCTVEYYYEDKAGHYPDTCEASEKLHVELGTVIETVDVAGHLKENYIHDKTENLPLTVEADATKNLVKVYYALDKNHDDIADRYQVFVSYKSERGGTVTNDAEVVTLKDADGNFVCEAESITLVGSKVQPKSIYKFVNWTGEGLPADMAKKTDLAGMVLTDVKGGEEYVFTAHLKRKPSDYVRPDTLNTEEHYSYIIGYENGTLRPENTITRGEVATIFFRLLTDDARDKYWSQTNSFHDVPSDLWCSNAISTLANMGIINGFEDGSFQPNGQITRAQFSKIAVKFFDMQKYAAYAYEAFFTDVPEGAWYTSYVESAIRMGLISGFEDGSFRPEVNITRAQACVIVNRVLDRHPDADHLLSKSAMITWPDNTSDKWYYADMQEATNSHDYEMNSKVVDGDKVSMENWVKKLDQRDWAALERVWSDSHSATGGGEVVDK